MTDLHGNNVQIRIMMEKIRTHKDLEVWKNSIKLVTQIYKETNKFPKTELYGLTSQIRKSALSIPSNISEGAGRNHTKEFIQFLYISMGSLAELETQLIIASNLNYLSNQVFDNLNTLLIEIRSQLSGLIKSLQKRIL